MPRLLLPALIIAFLATQSAPRAGAMDAHDVLLSLPYAAKAALPLLLLPAALDQPERDLPFAALMLAAMTLPNAMALAKVYTGDAEGAPRWRKAGRSAPISSQPARRGLRIPASAGMPLPESSSSAPAPCPWRP